MKLYTKPPRTLLYESIELLLLAQANEKTPFYKIKKKTMVDIALPFQIKSVTNY